MDRRDFAKCAAVGGTGLVLVSLAACEKRAEEASHPEPEAAAAFELEELSIAELQSRLGSGELTSRSLTRSYLDRIDAIDKQGPALNAVLELNPDALAIADGLDEERRAGKVRGPLHGIPIILKDNIDTADRMTTTAGSLALAGSIPPRDAFVASRLRQAGAVLLAKANLSEWANFRSDRSSSGWSGRGGQTKNPYALDRNPCGSSSGLAVAVSANLCAAALGTETNGSVVCPSQANGIVGIKPSVGLVSRAGIIPIAHSQDTAGPMARSVADAAALLGPMTGVDPRDQVTSESQGKAHGDYTPFLDRQGLKGARIGVARNTFGFHERVDRLMEEALEAMKAEGATIVDPAEIKTKGKAGSASFDVLLYEFKHDIAAYLAALGPNAPARTLKDLIEFNEAHRDRELRWFGQDIFLKAEEKGPLTSPEYKEALEKVQRLSRTEGIDATLAEHQLDAIVAPTGGPAWMTDLVNGDHFGGGSSSPAARAGYPNITVPAGQVFGLPVGISFFAGAWSEPTLIRLAFAFEQATGHRKPPRFLPSAELG